MKHVFIFLFLCLTLVANSANEGGERVVIDLNGTWQFDQTVNAFPPVKFTRTIPVPGLVHIRMVEPHQPGSNLLFNLAGVNNYPTVVSGSVKLKVLDGEGKTVSEQIKSVKLQPYLRTELPVSIQLPELACGYLLVAEFAPENGQPVISRRFLKVGQAARYTYFNLNPFSK